MDELEPDDATETTLKNAATLHMLTADGKEIARRRQWWHTDAEADVSNSPAGGGSGDGGGGYGIISAPFDRPTSIVLYRGGKGRLKQVLEKLDSMGYDGMMRRKTSPATSKVNEKVLAELCEFARSLGKPIVPARKTVPPGHTIIFSDSEFHSGPMSSVASDGRSVLPTVRVHQYYTPNVGSIKDGASEELATFTMEWYLHPLVARLFFRQ